MKKNPNTEVFPLGTTELIIHVRAKDSSFMTYRETIIVEKKAKKTSGKSSASTQSSWKTLGFPIIFLETKRNITRENDTIICETTSDVCKLNFAFSGGIK